MNGRLRAAALIAGLMALPLQASPTFADSCELVSTNGSLNVNGLGRSWRINVDGVTYQSDAFDKLTRQTRKRTVKEWHIEDHGQGNHTDIQGLQRYHPNTEQ